MTTNVKRKYAVVDLEATSASSNAKIIQIGIVIIQDGQIVETYETDVNPHEQLDEHIRQLTGITNQQLKKAPDFSQVARQVYEMIEDAVFVAHNVKFDANLLAESLFWEGFELTTPRIDTVELAQVFFPTLERYNLSSLCEELAIPLDHAHSAISDAQATAQLFLKLRETIASLPRELVETLLPFSDNLIYESRLLIEDAFEDTVAFHGEDLTSRHGIFLRKPLIRSDAKNFSDQFDINIQLMGMEARPLQKEFAQAIEESLQSSRDVATFVEGPTGIGKTYGYLLPLLAHTKDQIVVSVPTKVLQDQIMQQEAKMIEDVFQTSFHSLKSPQNYLKLDEFFRILHEPEENRLWNRFKMQLLVWLTQTRTGDLNEVGQLHRYGNFVQRIRHDGKLSKKSLFYTEDFWHLGQEKAKMSRVLLTNHAYLLTRLEDDPSLVENRTLVVDEAQKLYFSLEQFSRASLSLSDFMLDLQREIEIEKSLLKRRILESLQFELNALLKHLESGSRKVELTPEQVKKIRQDLSELDSPVLAALKTVFDPRFQIFWIDRTQENQHPIIRLQSGREGLVSLQDFIPTTTRLLLVSATLSISKKVNLASILGIENYQFIGKELSYHQGQTIFIDREFPDLTNLTQEELASSLASYLDDLTATGLPLFALFTSKDLLLATSQLMTVGHLAQYKNGEAATIKRRFDRGEASVLLGSGSFWEGVDFAQQAKIIQVIPRIPFDNPSDFFVQKLHETLRLEGKNPFYDYSLPLAILRLKQALGRSSRSSEQESLVILLDQRLLNRQYGSQIQASLEKIAPLVIAKTGEVKEVVEQFRS